MKTLFAFAFAVPLLFWSCFPLTVDVETESSEGDVSYVQEVTLDDGEEKRVVICYGSNNALLIQVTEINQTGYIKVSLKSASDVAEGLHISDMIIKIYDDEPLIGDSEYTPYDSYDRDSDTAEYYFISDGAQKFIILYHENSDYSGLLYGDAVFDLRVESFAYSVEPPQPEDEYEQRSISAGQTDSVSVPFLGESAYIYTLNDIEIDKFYSVAVSLDKSASVLGSDYAYYFTGIGLIASSLSLEKYYNDSVINEDICIFQITSDEGLSGTVGDAVALRIVECFTGDLLTVELQETTEHIFADDAFEPDQGPVTAGDIIDTGHQTSELHTIIDRNEDWILWEPWGAGDYRITVQLTDAWYPDSSNENFECGIGLNLIDPNGADELEAEYYNFDEAPVSPVVSSDQIEFTLESDTGEPYFIQTGSAWDLSYRVIVDKL